MARLIPPIRQDADPFDLMIGSPLAVRNIMLPAGMTAKEAKRIVDAYKAAGKIPMEDVFKFFKSGAKGGGQAIKKAGQPVGKQGIKFLQKEEDIINTLLGFPGG